MSVLGLAGRAFFMPYRLEQSDSGYYVVGPRGRHSKRPLSRRRAAAQMRALYAAEKDDGAMLHGPGGLMATPGVGKRCGRKWGNRTKDAACTCGVVTKAERLAPGVSRIHGDLCNVHGRYGSCRAAGFGAGPASGMQLSRSAAPKTPRASGAKRAAGGKKGGGKGGTAAKPKKATVTPEQRQAERDAKQAENRKKVLEGLGIDAGAQQALDDLRNGKQPDAEALKRAGAVQAGLVEQAEDGSYRLTGTGRSLLAAADAGDAGRAGDTISAARDRTTARTERQRAAAERKRAAEERRKKGGKRAQPKGSGGPKPSTPAQQQRDAERKQRQAAADQRRAEADKRRQAAEQRRQQNERARQTTSAQREELRQRVLTDLAQRMQSGNKLDDTELQKLVVEGLAERRGNIVVPTAAGKRQARRKPATKSFTVFKDASGAYRWVMRSTTAYRDRDGEIITTKALEADAERMTATGQYGPLRYWHIGQPDPFDLTAPWGPGLDLGDCDYSIVIGRTSIESGTFKSAAIGRAFAASADDYEASPGFFHPPDQPNVAGEYNDIRRFERSTVPIKFGRASNLFTGMAVKEHRMDQATYEARVKAFMADMNAKGVPPEVAARSLASMEQADKSATAQGIAYKSEQPPDPWAAVLAALKAAVAPPAVEAVEAEKAPPMTADAETPDETAVEGGTEEPGGSGDYIGDMSASAFWGQLTQVVQQAIAPALKMDDMLKTMGTHMGELKSMYTTKDAGIQARIAQLETEIAALKGDRPAVDTNEALAALKSTGPQAPPSTDAPQVPDDPNRPLAGLAAGLMPQLYGGAVQGFAGANGWQLGQAQPNNGGN